MRDTAHIKSLNQESDIRFTIHDSPVGALFLLGTDSCLKSVIFTPHGEVLSVIENTFQKGKTSQTTRASVLLNKYFSDPSSLSNPCIKTFTSTARSIISLHYSYSGHETIDLDLGMFTPGEIAVYCALLGVNPGSTISYGSLSRLAGIQRGARFVGNVMAKNAFPILIPCHRVVRSNGSIGGFTGGTEWKLFLLNHEEATIKP